MDIIPAIDLKNKKCVRLYKGEYEKSVTYNEDPIQQAKEFEKMGFKKIHIIDIDAATNNPSKNKDVITQIKNKILGTLRIQLPPKRVAESIAQTVELYSNRWYQVAV